MSLESSLASVPVRAWKTGQAVVFDWYDGPRAGVCRLENPAVEFAFDLLDERFNEDTLDDRLFRLSELPAGSVAAVLTVLRQLGQPAGPVWVPTWRFPDEAARAVAEQHLQTIEASKRATELVVFTRDMEEFLGCWSVAGNGRNGGNWFSVLDPSQQLT
jgi:hypothetical protein